MMTPLEQAEMRAYFAELDAREAQMTPKDKAECNAYFKHLESKSDTPHELSCSDIGDAIAMEMRDSTICEMSDSTICEMSDSTICELDECLHFESMSDTPSSMDDETPIMEKMYMVHEDDDITPCLLEDEHGGHMEPTTSTTPTSYERDYKGTQTPMSTSIEHELTKRALESMIQKKPDDTPVTWREYEALRDHLSRELRVTTETFDTEIQGVNLKVDETTTAINTVQTSMTTLQASMNTLTQAVHDIRTMVQQQPQHPFDEDGSVNGDNADAAAQGMGRGVGRGLPRGVNRGFVEIGARRVPLQQDDGLGKPKFSIPRFEGGTDVEEYLTWELKIERLWRLHPDYTEDKKIKLASSEFDGYALRWWDALVQNREEDGELAIVTWRTMKAAMRARFVPTNYLRSVFDKLTQLKQGVLTVDAYYMEMEMLMQRARVRESLEMTMLQEKLPWPTKLKSRRGCWCTMADDFGPSVVHVKTFFSRF
ncbi:hypothetical protein QYE76_027043 [Lolium multiflorum]|uniref:Retrotransposon gag domain-containing protein n=1 Tax=Lolium multiflorum TaxID=4521 RepID=A0AAD8VE80_LOLMU|nr:hypothetical protein QYE76_027043 [Lolium multiflorum]